jgi:uncharacterized protein (UPF0210 family)
MKIRSITSFYDPRMANNEDTLKYLAMNSQKLNQAFSESGLSVQSTRLATIPFPLFLADLSSVERIRQVIRLEEISQQLGWAYLSLGPALLEEPAHAQWIPEMLRETKNVFFGGMIADNHHIYPRAVTQCAEVIHQNAPITPDGFTNLRFAALANVQPWTPFLPAAYHQPGDPAAISIALECADVVQDIFRDTIDIEKSRQNLIVMLEETSRELLVVIEKVLAGTGIIFKGFDFSPAPYPEDWCSLGGACERLGLEHIGGIGSLAAVAIIADTLDKGSWPKAGFNGMMLPVLEDSILARRADEANLTVNDLLLYSAVCGTGLDTIPLSGDIPQAQLASVLMDIAALAVRLGKPLTARLMPIPGKVAGEKTDFVFDFFANSRVMHLNAQSLKSPLMQSRFLSLTPRNRNH